MKRRHSIVYLIIFLLVTGYYYYYEVVERTRKEVAEAEAKKIFHVQEDRIQAVEILAKDQKEIRLKKEAEWRIAEPIQSDADKMTVQELLRTLAGLNLEREIVPAPADLKPYGLDAPALKLRFQAGDQWFEILLGNKAPVGDSRYAKTPEKPAVFLISGASWNDLNKGLADVRKRELFTFQPDDVIGMKIVWQDGAKVDIEREKDSKTWKAPAFAGLRIKSAKVENVLDQIQGLRAEGFLEDAAGNLAAHGLEPPRVAVALRLEGDREALLRLGAGKSDEKLAALSSQLPAVVQVDPGILDDIPKDARKFEDRSILGVEADEVTRVKWRLGDAGGEAIRQDPKTWQVKTADGSPRVLKESWRAKALLWNLGDAEYQAKVAPPPPLPAKPFAFLEFFKDEKSLCSLAWEKPPENDASPVTVWIGAGGANEPVQAEAKIVRAAAGDIEEIIQSGDAKAGP